MLDSTEPKNNFLLAALPSPEWQRWQPLLEQVDMPLGQVLYESGVALTHVYFPTTSIVSLLYVMENGASAEIAVVGNGAGFLPHQIEITRGDQPQHITTFCF